MTQENTIIGNAPAVEQTLETIDNQIVLENENAPVQNKNELANKKGEGMSVRKGSDIFSSFMENLIHNYKAAQKGGVENKIIDAADLIDWKQAEDMGLSRDVLTKNGGLAAMLKGGKTDLLLIAVRDKNSGVIINTFARLSLVQDKETGRVSFKTNLLRNDLDLTKYCGTILTDEDRANLLSNGNAGRLIEVKFKNDEMPKLVYLSLDKQTNELIAFDASKVRIPSQIAGKELTQEQQDLLRAGKAVKIEGMTSNVTGKEFSSTLQFSALEKRFVFVGAGAKIPHKMGGVELTEEQRNKLILGEILHMVGLTNKTTGKKYNSYIRWNTKLDKIQFSSTGHFKSMEVAPTLEHKTQVAGNNDGHKPESLKNVKKPLGQKQPSEPTQQQKAKKAKMPQKPRGMRM